MSHRKVKFIHLDTPEETRAYWKRLMKNGRARFVVETGILRYAGPFTIGALLIPQVLLGRSTTLRVIVESMLFAVVVGTAYGLFAWYYFRRKYRITS
jgi:hypothetical protein